MKAALAGRYGPPDVVIVRDVPVPVAGPGNILIRVMATTVSAGDVRMRAFDVPGPFWLPFRLVLGVFRPRKPILGVEFAGVVDTVGAGVTRFAPGDRVFGYNSHGCHAEWKVMRADLCVAQMPESLGFAQAAALPHGGLAALDFLRRAGLHAGSRVLVNGAAGAVGVIAVQLAKHFGAEVTAVCGAAHLDLVRGLGADRVIDYRVEDFSECGGVYDIILDTVGSTTFAACRRVLAKDGVQVFLVTGLREMLQWGWSSLRGAQRVIGGVAAEEPAMLEELAALCDAGVLRAVIDRSYPLARIAEAHAYVDRGHKAGSVVIDVAGAE